MTEQARYRPPQVPLNFDNAYRSLVVCLNAQVLALMRTNRARIKAGFPHTNHATTMRAFFYLFEHPKDGLRWCVASEDPRENERKREELRLFLGTVQTDFCVNLADDPWLASDYFRLYCDSLRKSLATLDLTEAIKRLEAAC